MRNSQFDEKVQAQLTITKVKLTENHKSKLQEERKKIKEKIAEKIKSSYKAKLLSSKTHRKEVINLIINKVEARLN